MNETSLISVSAGELQQERTLEVIAGEIRTYSDLLAKSAIEIGRRLCEAKEMVPHGQFMDWVKENTGYSSRSAANFMRLFKEFSTEQSSLFGAEIKQQTFANLNYTKVLALVSLPESEREDFVVEHDVEHLSVREVERLVKERTAELEADKNAQALQIAALETKNAAMLGELECSAEEIKKSREIISELQAQPVATVTERDEAAIRAAADEAREATKQEFSSILEDTEKALKEQEKQLAAAKKERDKALKEAAALRRDMEELKKAEDKAEVPEETMDKLRAQYEEQIRQAEERAAAAEKQLKLATPAAGEFSTAFTRAQAELNTMHAALAKIEDGELAAKLRTAALAVLEKWAPKFKEV